MERSTALRTALLCSALLAGLLASAQGHEERATLFKDSSAISGGFLSFTPRLTHVIGSDVLLIGFGAGIIVDHRFGIGLAGAWSSSVIKNPAYEKYLQGTTAADLQGLELRYGYGGLLLESYILSRSAIHVAAPVIIGVGSVAYSYPKSNTGSNSNERNRIDGQAFFVVEPGLELELSIVKPLRIGFGGSYIWTSDIMLPSTSPDVLRNFTARMTMKFGGF